MSANKNNNNNTNPIDAIAREISAGVTFVSGKLIELLSSIIQGIIESLATKKNATKKSSSIGFKQGFKK